MTITQYHTHSRYRLHRRHTTVSAHSPKLILHTAKSIYALCLCCSNVTTTWAKSNNWKRKRRSEKKNLKKANQREKKKTFKTTQAVRRRPLKTITTQTPKNERTKTYFKHIYIFFCLCCSLSILLFVFSSISNRLK